MQMDDNKAVFDFALAQTIKAFKNSNYLETSAWAGIAGHCAAQSHAGFYVHAQLEEILLKIGRRLDQKAQETEIKITFSQGKKTKILHVFSVALPIGGHTRLVERWISNRSNNSECHSVLLLDQNFIRIPQWLKAAASKSGGSCITLPDDLNIIERALLLRKMSHETADLVVLHTGANDPIPLIAFAVDGGPPIILLNHSDHTFWYGSSIADFVADLRLMAQQLTLQKRKIINSRLLPIPLLPKKLLNKSSCRKELHLPDDKIILLSIAASHKFKPYNDSNFPKIVSAFVESHPNTILIVIGPSAEEISWKSAIRSTKGRVRVLGVVENIDVFYGAADIYLESFPIGSITSTLDAMLYELPVIQAPAPVFPLLHIDQYTGMQGNAPDVTHYYDVISQCVENNKLRLSLGRMQRQSVENLHIGNGWQKCINDVMDNLPSTHKINIIAKDVIAPDRTDITLADLQSKSAHCDKSALMNLINAMRAYSKYIRHYKLFATLLRALMIFGVSSNKSFWFELIKTIGSVGLPTKLYKKQRSAHLKKMWG